MDEDEFEDLDDLDWGDISEDLEANREALLAEATTEEEEAPAPAAANGAGSAPEPVGDIDLNFLLDVQLTIVVEAGRTNLKISKVLELDKGSVVEMDNSVGEPLDIRVNEQLVARGEIVVINEKFAIRLTDIVSPDERFATL